jgi:hypothetical protein
MDLNLSIEENIQLIMDDIILSAEILEHDEIPTEERPPTS